MLGPFNFYTLFTDLRLFSDKFIYSIDRLYICICTICMYRGIAPGRSVNQFFITHWPHQSRVSVAYRCRCRCRCLALSASFINAKFVEQQHRNRSWLSVVSAQLDSYGARTPPWLVSSCSWARSQVQLPSSYPFFSFVCPCLVAITQLKVAIQDEAHFEFKLTHNPYENECLHCFRYLIKKGITSGIYLWKCKEIKLIRRIISYDLESLIDQINMCN